MKKLVYLSLVVVVAGLLFCTACKKKEISSNALAIGQNLVISQDSITIISQDTGFVARDTIPLGSISETWTCNEDRYNITLYINTSDSIIYSVVNSNVSPGMICFANDLYYQFSMKNDSIMEFTKCWRASDTTDLMNSVYNLDYISTNEVLVRFVGYAPAVYCYQYNFNIKKY